jgi:hypothetical protein
VLLTARFVVSKVSDVQPVVRVHAESRVGTIKRKLRVIGLYSSGVGGSAGKKAIRRHKKPAVGDPRMNAIGESGEWCLRNNFERKAKPQTVEDCLK